jgi:hypothetical protein
MSELTIEKLKISITGYYHDINAFKIHAKYDAIRSHAESLDDSMPLRDLEIFLESCENALKFTGSEHVIELSSMESSLSLKLEMDKLGHIVGDLNITPDQVFENHSYVLDLDQSYLPDIIKQCKDIIQNSI